MNRQQAKELLPIIQAFAEGKTIQIKALDGLWHDDKGGNISFYAKPKNYRIKPEPKYRPFKNREECWQEMQKHKPFGWTKSMPDKHFTSIVEVINDGCIFTYGHITSFNDIYKFNTFADGTPFGIKEEK